MTLGNRVLAGLVALAAVSIIACAPPASSTLTVIPTPTATEAPTEQTIVTNESLAHSAMGYLTGLVNDLGSRESASEGESKAADYLKSRYSELGYSSELDRFTVERFNADASGLTFQSDDTDDEKIRVLPLQGSTFGQVSGPLVSVGLGRPEDLPQGGLAGKIALVERGQVTFESKARTAADAGAIGVLIYNNLPGNFRGDLDGSSGILVVSVSQTDGNRLTGLASTGGSTAMLTIQQDEVPSRNVLAEKKGPGDKLVIIGAHFDTVPGTQGANDNTSGTAAILALAELVSEKPLPFTVRFVSFGAEELGLLGSRSYVDSLSEDERGRIIAMLNFDAVGSGTGLGVLGDSQLTDIATRQAELAGIGLEVSPGLDGASSDHASFAAVGIPVLMLLSDDSSRIHTEMDTLDTINPELLGDAVRLGLDVLEALALELYPHPGNF